MESVPHSSLSSMRPLQPEIGCRSGRLSTREERVRGCWDADHRLPRHACARHTCGAGNHRHNSPRERCLKWRELALRINCGRCSFSHTKQLPTFVASQSLTWQSAVSSQTTSNSVAPELNWRSVAAVLLLGISRTQYVWSKLLLGNVVMFLSNEIALFSLEKRKECPLS
jgi:hypothetical protein